MNKYLNILKQTEILAGLTDGEILSALSCMGATVKTIQKGFLLYEGDSAKIGIILSGSINIRKTDYYGNDNIILKLGPSDMFGESAVYSPEKKLPFDIVCETSCEIIYLDSEKLIRPCSNICLFHNQIIENLISCIAKKNVQLTKKIDILTKRNLRDKILAYLHDESRKVKSKRFTVPLNRNQMADFLSTDRSALSRELSNMRGLGIIDYTGKSFILLG